MFIVFTTPGGRVCGSRGLLLAGCGSRDPQNRRTTSKAARSMRAQAAAAFPRAGQTAQPGNTSSNNSLDHDGACSSC